MKGYAIAIFSVVFMILFVLGSGAYSSVFMERDASIFLSDDTRGMIALSPIGGEVFSDSNGDGAYELSISDAQSGASTTYEQVFRITNNMRNEVLLKISDSGIYSDNVIFHSGESNLESDGVYIDVGNSIIVDIDVHADGVGAEETMVGGSSSMLLKVYDQQGLHFFTLSRSATIVTSAAVGEYPCHDIFMDLEYLRQIIYQVHYVQGDTIRTNTHQAFEDMGLIPEQWTVDFGGYKLGYVEIGGLPAPEGFRKGSAIKIIAYGRDIIVYSLSGEQITINANNSFYYNVYDGLFYAPGSGSADQVIFRGL